MRQIKKFAFTLAALLTLAAGAVAQTPTYGITVTEGTDDADKWTATPNPAEADAEVTVNYSGKLKVSSVSYVVPVTEIKLNKTETEIAEGETETLTVSSVLPEAATDKTYTWSSDNEAVATVDASTGKVTAVINGTVTKPATANIIATANDGSGVTAKCTVTVNYAPVTTGNRPFTVAPWNNGTGGTLVTE